ncbi:MAG: hypothetical protein ACYDCO_04960 [Armatimonadota bacterium]
MKNLNLESTTMVTAPATRKRPRRRWLLVAVICLLAGGLWLGYHLTAPKRYRLVATLPFSFGTTVTQAGVVVPETVTREMSPGSVEIGTSSLALYNWQGKKRWRIKLPEPYNGYALSPDGRRLIAEVTDHGRPALQYWLDGTPAWRLAIPRSSSAIALYCLDNGLVYYWQDDRLTAIRDGQVVAANPHLPRDKKRANPKFWYDYTVYWPSSDCSTLIGTTPIFDLNISGTHGPGLEYSTLKIIGKRIVATHRYTDPQADGYLVFPGGRILTRDGTVYNEKGIRHRGPAWTLPTVHKGTFWDRCGMSDDRNFNAAVQVHAKEARVYDFKNYRFRIIDLQTIQAWELPRAKDPTEPRCSANGQYAAALTYIEKDDPPGALGRLNRRLKLFPLVRNAIFSRIPDRYELRLYTRPGRLRARLPLFMNHELEVDGQRYRTVDYFVSPDGHGLVIRAKEPPGDRSCEERLFFYRW